MLENKGGKNLCTNVGSVGRGLAKFSSRLGFREEKQPSKPKYSNTLRSNTLRVAKTSRNMSAKKMSFL